MLLGQEDHAHAVFTGWRQGHALRRHFFAIQRVGQLDQYASAVAHQLVGANRASVVQVFQNLQRVLNDVVRLGALDMGDKAHATRVVFVIG